MGSLEHNNAYLYLPANLHYQPDFWQVNIFFLFFLDMPTYPIISQI